MKVSYPIRFSLPVTASRLMSAIMRSVRSIRPPMHALRRMKACVAAIRISTCPVRREPGGPSDLARCAEADGRSLARRERELRLPFELIADVEEDRVGERRTAVAGRQKARVVRKILRVDANADLVLDAVDRPAHDDITSEHAILGAEMTAIIRLNHQPVADELLHFGTDSEQPADQGAQSGG